jgi:hypothetical protein
LTIYAAEPWNATGLYLGAGEHYEFEATGQWLDRDIPCGPAGASDGKFHVGEIAHLAGSVWGKVESAFKKLTENAEADFRGTKRVEKAPWFALIGFIANGAQAENGEPIACGTFAIKEGTACTVERAGYLYCFANDAWNFYDNNRGSVRLKIKRVS